MAFMGTVPTTILTIGEDLANTDTGEEGAAVITLEAEAEAEAEAETEAEAEAETHLPRYRLCPPVGKE